MASTTVLQKNMDQRRSRILEAARSIIVENGVDGLSVRQLAQKSGLVVKTLYNLFGSKENILVALIEQGTEEIDSTVAAAAGSVNDFSAALDIIEQAVFANAHILKPAMVANFHLTGARDPGAMAMHQRRIDAVANALEIAKSNGLVREDTDAKIVGSLLYRTYTDALTDWAFGTLRRKQFVAQARFNVLVAIFAFASDDIRSVVSSAIRLYQRELQG